ncbi:type VI secretion system tube protein Hcp [Lutibacter sp.]|uniref:type VI secretion system tube protein Hcp n=1 Tax=Lutibacter sp. TaxID=1925666 RepID=UPI002736CD30|nr:type VI secretion system tube protein Hcp [Lutibacter sp.]MDP3313062.1 type VI secretion system tube protein Hcp [Lutibacter sp.]
MKTKFITIAFIAITCITSQLFAQEATSKTTGYDVKKNVKCRVSPTETGYSISFEYDVKSPRDAASGMATGKRQHEQVRFIREYSVSSTDNSVTEVISPRDAASGLPTGKRQHKPVTITKEIDKSSPKLAEAVAKGKSSSDSPPSEIAIDEQGVHKVSMQDFHFTKRCDVASTKYAVVDGVCEIPTDDCPNGVCTLTADWSWGANNASSTGLSSTGTGMSRSSVDFYLKIEDGACTAMAINEKGLPGDKKPNKGKNNNPK